MDDKFCVKVSLPNGDDIGVNFRHKRTLQDDGALRTVTYADLFFVQAGRGQLVQSGTAVLSRKDRFEREVGRKVALAKVLKKFEMPQNERALVWDAYFRRGDGTQDPRRPRLNRSLKRFVNATVRRKMFEASLEAEGVH